MPCAAGEAIPGICVWQGGLLLLCADLRGSAGVAGSARGASPSRGGVEVSPPAAPAYQPLSIATQIKAEKPWLLFGLSCTGIQSDSLYAA